DHDLGDVFAPDDILVDALVDVLGARHRSCAEERRADGDRKLRTSDVRSHSFPLVRLNVPSRLLIRSVCDFTHITQRLHREFFLMWPGKIPGRRTRTSVSVRTAMRADEHESCRTARVARIAMLERRPGPRKRPRFERPMKDIRDRIAMTQLTHCHAARERAAFPWQDLAIVLGATVLAALVCMRIEFAERVFDFSRNWEHWQVDELAWMLFVLAIGMAWFAWRRYRE